MKKLFVLAFLVFAMVGCFSKDKDDSSLQNEKETKAIIGSNDLQYVEQYIETKGIPRSFVDTHKGAVGKLISYKTSSSIAYGSGTLISKNLFLTAAHCIPSDRNLMLNTGYVLFDYENGKTPVSYKINKIVDVKYIEGKTLGKGWGVGVVDFAIIELEGTPGLTYGYADLRVKSPSIDGNVLTIIQHPSGQKKQVAIEYGSDISDYDVDMLAGSSGSGILSQKGHLVGVNDWEGTDNLVSLIKDDVSNHGTSTYDIYHYSTTVKNMLKNISKINVSGNYVSGTTYNSLPYPPYRLYNKQPFYFVALDCYGNNSFMLTRESDISLCAVTNKTFIIEEKSVTGQSGSIPIYTYSPSFIKPGTSFAITGFDESPYTEKTFTFYDENNVVINTISIGTNNVSQMLKINNEPPYHFTDEYLEFQFDGKEVTCKKISRTKN